MKLKPAYIIAIQISLLILVWFLVGGIDGLRSESTADDTQAIDNAPVTKSLPNVEIDTLDATLHESFIRLHGRTEPVREVSVKAETAGLVVKTPMREGRFAKQGTVLCEQDIDARQAMLDQAKALLQARQLEYQAAQTLVDKGYRSSTQALAALAALDGARATVKQAEIELGNVITRAPFSGIFEKQIAEIGDFLAPGQACGLLVDLDPLIITGEATERQIGLLSLGNRAAITLATGQSLTGKIRFIESRANPATRTFRIEVEVPNKNRTLKAGVTANIKLSAGQTKAHFIPSRVLTLDDNGHIGVRYVDANKRVRFTTVTTIDETNDGIWVTGLPSRTDLIVRGQDFVSEGSEVQTQYDLKADTVPANGSQ